MRLRDLKRSNVLALEEGDDRIFLEDLFELESMGEYVPTLERDTSEFLLYDRSYQPLNQDDIWWDK